MTGRRGASLFLAGMLAGVAPPPPAAADGAGDASFAVRLEGCARVLDEGAFRRHLGAELDAAGASRRPRSRLRVRCAGRAAALRAVTRGRRAVDRRLDLGEVPQDAAARLVALGAAELVVSSWSAPLLGPGEVPDDTGDGGGAEGETVVPEDEEGEVPAVGPPPGDAAAAAPAWTVGLGGQWAFEPSVALGGLRVGWETPLVRILRLGVSLEGFFTGVDVDPGRLFVLPASATVELRIEDVVDRVRAYGALGIRGGVVWFVGEPSDAAQTRGDRFVAPWGAAVLAVGARWDGARPSPGLRVEAGYVIFPAEARFDEEVVYPFSGLSLSLFAELSFG